MKKIKREAIVGTIGLSVTSGITALAMTVIAIFQNSFCEMHGYTATQFSVALSLFSGAGIVTGVFLGKLVSKFGIKKLAIAASISPAIALIGMRFSGSIIIAYVFAIVSGLLVALSTTAVLNLYIGSWFNKGKGTMTSVGQTIATLFSIVFVPVVTSLLVAQGAEKASIFVGIIMLAVGIAGALFVKGMPSEYGVEPVDIVERKTTENDAAASTEIYDVQMPTVKLISKAPVAALLIMTFLTIVGLAMFGTYSVYIFDSYLNNMVTASFYVSITSACVLGFSMLFGMLCDKVGVTPPTPTITGAWRHTTPRPAR